MRKHVIKCWVNPTHHCGESSRWQGQAGLWGVGGQRGDVSRRNDSVSRSPRLEGSGCIGEQFGWSV